MAQAKLPLYCIYQSSWLDYNGIELTLTKQGNRVVFEAPANEKTYRLLQEYQNNPTVPLLAIVGSLRKTRARMLDLRDGKRGRETADGNRRDF